MAPWPNRFIRDGDPTFSEQLFEFTGNQRESMILKAAVEREKAVQAIDGHREWKNGVVTLWVMSQFSHLQGVVQTFVIRLLFLG